MDPVKILKRAWQILWSYKALWVFGFILALTAAGSSGGNANNGSSYQGSYDETSGYTSSADTPEEFFIEAKVVFDNILE